MKSPAWVMSRSLIETLMSAPNMHIFPGVLPVVVIFVVVEVGREIVVVNPNIGCLLDR